MENVAVTRDLNPTMLVLESDSKQLYLNLIHVCTKEKVYKIEAILLLMVTIKIKLDMNYNSIGFLMSS